MGCTVTELLSRISSRELSEWLAYERVSGPFGNQRDDYHAAMIAERVHNALRMSKPSGRTLTVDDFMPHWGLADHGNDSRPDD